MSHNHSKKRQKVDNFSKTTKHKFSSAEEIRQALRNVDQATVTDALTGLRNQLTLRKAEPPIAPQDERLLLAKQWLEISPGAEELFQLLDSRNQTATVAMAVSVLACLLTLLSSHFIYQALGQPILKSLLSSQWIRRLESYLGGSHTDLTLVTVKLLNAMSNYSGGKEQKSLLDAFSWDTKSFNKLLFMRRKGKNADNHDMLAKPDIRTLCLLFVLSFVSPSSSTHVKVVFLEHHRDLFISIFRGLNNDPYPVAREVLEVCWTGIWQDPKIKRTLKVGLFNEATLQQIVKLYDRTTQEGPDPEHVPADLVHHFLLAICSHRGIGICFADHGWYPRTNELELDSGEEVPDTSRPRGGKIYNKILSNLVKTLKVNEDSRQQELALKIMAACPELVAGYWQAAALTLEPRLSSKWLANIAFFGVIISLPVPTESFFLPPPPASTSSSHPLYQPAPPPLSNVMENILPSMSIKTHFTKGLQSPSALVQHSTAVGLVRCLVKCEDVLSMFRQVKDALEEDEATGQWARRIREVEREVRKRVPEFQVIVAFSQQKLASASKDGVVPHLAAKASLISEISQRLLWLYHRCVPSLVAEARFDVGKSLQTFLDRAHVDHPAIEDAGVDTADGLDRLRKLHVLRMLRESDQFVWSGKASSSSHSNIYILIKLFTRTMLPSVRDALASLMTHTFSEDLLFRHDPTELHLWLDSLPTTVRATEAEAPDGAALTDEGEGVVAFLEDCMLRCAKTPYRYLEDLGTMLGFDEMSINGAHAVADDARTEASPLIMTVLEQIAIKVKNQSLSPSDTLALATYVRKLVVKLIEKHADTQFAQAVASKLTRTAEDTGLFAAYPVVSAAVQREITILQVCIAKAVNPVGVHSLQAQTTPVVQEFLCQVEKFPIPDTEASKKIHAYELVDWLRLVQPSLHLSEVERIITVLRRFHVDALYDFYLQLVPEAGLLWESVGSIDSQSEVLKMLSFDWLFLHASSEDLRSPSRRDLLVKTVQDVHLSVADCKRYLGLLMHRLKDPEHPDRSHILRIVVDLVQKAKSTFSSENLQLLKNFIFSECHVLRNIFCETNLQEECSAELDILVNTLLDPTHELDKILVSSICKQWITALASTFQYSHSQQSQIQRPLVWIKFMEKDGILHLLMHALSSTHRDDFQTTSVHNPLLEEVLQSVNRLPLSETSDWLQQQLPNLLSFRRLLPHSSVLEQLITNSINASIPLGHDGFALSSGSEALPAIISQAQARWSSRLTALPEDLNILPFLDQHPWSEQLVAAISGIIYRSSAARDLFWKWLHTSVNIQTIGITRLTGPLHAFLDSSSRLFFADRMEGTSEGIIASYFDAIACNLFDAMRSQREKALFASCITLILDRLPSKRQDFFRMLQGRVASQSVDTINIDVLGMAVILARNTDLECNDFTDSLIDHGLQWTVRRLSDKRDIEDADSQAMSHLISLIKSRKKVAAHFAEPVLAAAIRHYILHEDVVNFAEAIFSCISLKPVNVNRHLQSVLQHPQLQHIAAASDSQAGIRDAVAGLLYSLFNQHPSNTCQPTHIQPLVRLYSGTLSTADRRLFSIFHLFEDQRKVSTASIFAQWAPSGAASAENCLEALTNLDPSRVLRTCLNFPVRRPLRIEAKPELVGRLEEGQIYDPVFVMLLFAHAMLDGPPQSTLTWLQVLRTNVISLIVRVLSSKDPALREVAVSQISSLWVLMKIHAIKTADLQERDHLTYILNLIRDLLPLPSDDPPKRVASYTTLVLAHALRGVFYPSNFIYPLTARFLLQRPELDPHDVPLLYGMLYSNSEDWKKERSWIIKFLGDGLLSTDDWRVFRRRHTWDLLASLMQSSQNDRALRNGVLEVLASLTCNAQATTSLMLKSSLVQWIEIQLQTLRNDETIAWVKILENMLVVVDVQKVEHATKGEWRAGIARCLNNLARGANIHLLRICTRTVLRLTVLPFSPPRNISAVVATGLRSLENFEETSKTPAPCNYRLRSPERDDALPPHRSLGLHQPPVEDDLQAWGNCVEQLWQIVMACEARSKEWDQLSCRILVWSSIVREQGSVVGQWTREEVVRCLSVERNDF